MSESASKSGATIWISSQPTPDGVYRPVLDLDADTAVALTEATVGTYTRQLLRAACIAEHDAAVVAQLSALTGRKDVAAQLLADLRAERPAVQWSTALSVTPGVSTYTGAPFLTVHIHGRPAGQWSPAQAREHVLAVQMALEIADLDAAYLRTLRTIGVDEQRARAAVAALADHR